MHKTTIEKTSEDGRVFAPADPAQCDGPGIVDSAAKPVDGAVDDDVNHLTDPCPAFDDMGLKDNLLRGIYSLGFEIPSMIQQRAVRPLALSHRDIIAQAQSGTGKTACFSIGLLQNIEVESKVCQAIILSPTRELAKQSASVASALGSFLGVQVTCIVGGCSLREHADALRRGACQLVVATPGRCVDILRRGMLRPQHVTAVVLDEADEMLSLGFKDQIQDILELLPRSAKLALFSATLPPESLELASKWMPDALRIVVKKEELTLAGIKAFFVYCGEGYEHDKLTVLSDIYSDLSITAAVIFVNTRRRAEWLTECLNAQDFTVSTIHADLTQAERTDVLKAFREGRSRVLVATDVLARGIDVQQVNLVVNFDLPRDMASYIHRVGRSGRFGRKGAAISLLSGSTDVRSLREIEKYYECEIHELPSDLSILEANE